MRAMVRLSGYHDGCTRVGVCVCVWLMCVCVSVSPLGAHCSGTALNHTHTRTHAHVLVVRESISIRNMFVLLGFAATQLVNVVCIYIYTIYIAYRCTYAHYNHTVLSVYGFECGCVCLSVYVCVLECDAFVL